MDVLQPDVRRWGVTPLRKVAALAETYYVAIAPRHSGGPIATAAALQVAAAIPNFYTRPQREGLGLFTLVLLGSG